MNSMGDKEKTARDSMDALEALLNIKRSLSPTNQNWSAAEAHQTENVALKCHMKPVGQPARKSAPNPSACTSEMPDVSKVPPQQGYEKCSHDSTLSSQAGIRSSLAPHSVRKDVIYQRAGGINQRPYLPVPNPLDKNQAHLIGDPCMPDSEASTVPGQKQHQVLAKSEQIPDPLAAQSPLAHGQRTSPPSTVYIVPSQNHLVGVPLPVAPKVEAVDFSRSLLASKTAIRQEDASLSLAAKQISNHSRQGGTHPPYVAAHPSNTFALARQIHRETLQPANSHQQRMPSNYTSDPDVSGSASNAMRSASHVKSETASGTVSIGKLSSQTLPKPEDVASNLIRREEVEAALHSRPQRGKKRENLSMLERLELTRTRNREHAKSTRVRKKARYQELEGIERQYKVLQEKEELSRNRRECVVNFLQIRSSMLSNLARGNYDSNERKCSAGLPEETSSTSPCNQADNGGHGGTDGMPVESRKPAALGTENNDGTPQRAARTVSFLTDRQSARKSPMKDGVHTGYYYSSISDDPSLHECILTLEDVVEDAKTFQLVSVSCGAARHIGDKGIAAMSLHDNAILEHVRSLFGHKGISSVEYKMPCGSGAVALAANDTGYVGFEVQAYSGQGAQETVAPGILRVEFPSGSSKIRSFSWCVYGVEEPHLEAEQEENIMPQLDRHRSFPSVISLENSNPSENGNGVA